LFAASTNKNTSPQRLPTTEDCKGFVDIVTTDWQTLRALRQLQLEELAAVLARRRERTGRARLAGVLFAPVDYGSYSRCIHVHERLCCLGITSWPSLHSSQWPTPEAKLRSKEQEKNNPTSNKEAPRMRNVFTSISNH
jgi:hypothetical protein